MIETRAASSPLATTSSASFNQTTSVDDVAALAQMSALNGVKSKAVTVILGGPSSSVFIPSALTTGTALKFVAQGAGDEDGPSTR